jgi:hypothetical protein
MRKQHIILGRGRFVHKQHLNSLIHHMKPSQHGYGTASVKKQGMSVLKPLKFRF